MLSHAQEPSECHALILVKGVGRNFPRRQPCVHVSVERKALLIDQASAPTAVTNFDKDAA